MDETITGGVGGGGERKDKVEENKGGSNEKGNVDTRSKESRAFSSCSVWTEYIFSLKGLYS